MNRSLPRNSLIQHRRLWSTPYVQLTCVVCERSGGSKGERFLFRFDVEVISLNDNGEADRTEHSHDDADCYSMKLKVQ